MTPTRQDAAGVLGLGVAWFALLVLATHDLVSGYFPLADEWALLAESHPAFADPVHWFTQGFGAYFVPPAGIPHEPGNPFVRPLFNLAYWVCGQFLSPTSGGYLVLNYLAMAAVAALTARLILRSGAPRALALGLAATLPLMPSLIPALEPVIYPCMGFDAVAAVFVLMAILAYQDAHLARSALWLLLAVLTKETALPVAAALPAFHLYTHRHGRGRALQGLREGLLLALPMLVWAGLYLQAFHAPSSLYVLQETGHGALYRTLRLLSKWPFWVEPSVLWRAPGASLEKALAVALLLANAALLLAVLQIVRHRWRHGPALQVDEAGLLASYAFLLLVGTNPRYGVILDALLLAFVARTWRAHRTFGRPSHLLMLALLTGLSATVVQTAQRWPRLHDHFLSYAEIGTRYVAALRSIAPDRTVLVLNDPVTFWTPVHWMATTLQLRTPLIKLADYAWSPDDLAAIDAPCRVHLVILGQAPLRLRFTQTCGIDLLSSTRWLDASARVSLNYDPQTRIDLIPYAQAPGNASHLRWEQIEVTTTHPRVVLLYFDPLTRQFVTAEPS